MACKNAAAAHVVAIAEFAEKLAFRSLHGGILVYVTVPVVRDAKMQSANTLKSFLYCTGVLPQRALQFALRSQSAV